MFNPEKIAQDIVVFIKMLEDVIEEGIKNGEFYDDNVKALASGVFGVTCSSLIYRLNSNESLNVEDVYNGFIDTVVRGIIKI